MERKYPFIPGNNSQAWNQATASHNVFDCYSKTFSTPGMSNSIWISDCNLSNISGVSNEIQNKLLISNSFELTDGFTNTGETNWLILAKDGIWKGCGAQIYSSGKRSGSLGAGIKSSDSYIQTPQVKDPAILEFWSKTSAAASANYTIEIQASANSSDWAAYTNFIISGSSGSCGINGNGFTNILVYLSLTGNYYIRWHRLAGGSSTGVFYMDDVTINSK